MSRSYKKSPVITDGHSGRVAKKEANRKVRKYRDVLANGKAYRKVFESYDIHDFIIHYSYASYKKDVESHQKEYDQGIVSYPFCETEQEWRKSFQRK